MKPRIIIIGAGGAGLSAAIEAANHDVDIIIITKGYYRNKTYKWASNGGCTWKTHGFNAAISKSDSVESHIQDTLKGGSFANNKKLVETLCYGSVDLVDWLSKMNVNLDMNGASVDTRPFGGCGTPRSVFIEDRLGFHIQNAFNKRIDDFIESGKITLMENMRGMEILKNDDGSVCGVVALQIDTLEKISISCDAVIVADGGGASMYAPTAVSHDKTCDGIVMALNAGASIIDMEFVQFHPTGIATNVSVFDGSLVEEVLRFDGAQLINNKDERFMFKYNSLGETATRDQVARGIYNEILNGNDFENKSIRLDITSCSDIIYKKYPALSERLIQAGYDIKKSPSIYIRPTAHFLMGGIKINEKAETHVKGLYAAGESAGGVHGANRLGGNGLSEALVFGRIAGASSVMYASSRSITSTQFITTQGAITVKSDTQEYSPDALLNTLRRSMYWSAGPIKNTSNMKSMLCEIKNIQSYYNRIDFGSGSRSATTIQQFLDLKNLAMMSEIIIEASLLRKESRGSHYVEDYKQTSDEFTGIELFYSNGNLKQSYYSNEDQALTAVNL